MAENNTDKHHKSDKYASFVLSIVAIVVAVVALAISTPRHIGEDCCGKIDLGIDYLGIIIGLLALMVTLMVAWNIWQTIEAKRSIERFEEKTNNYEKDLDDKVKAVKTEWIKEIQNIQNKTKLDVAETESYVRGFVASDVYHKLHHLHNMILDASKNKDTELFSPFDNVLYNFLFHSIKGLWHGISGKPDVSYCNQTLITMINWLDYFPKDSLNETQKTTIYSELEKIEPKIGRLRRYKEFKKKLNDRQTPF